ncbi:hypothetical protein [Paenarthrobacter aurescens]|jgi:hypothetical protein|uniref:Uncharacterized protein n=1 Tax=Paenarthrobacter aurescens (strain TC1) TaxID=290340 RepID=A1RDL5_PAEAT|nr:hypothetical protein [Paenarthrobacter aurescens]ABM10745.1 hypothetical protein AAur_pTC20176 [Paenarthrobacter aurescens TC1]
MTVDPLSAYTAGVRGVKVRMSGHQGRQFLTRTVDSVMPLLQIWTHDGRIWQSIHASGAKITRS